jgi:hypothetical protein
MTSFAAELVGKRLNLLLELVPQVTKVGYLCSSDAPTVQARISDMLAAGRALEWLQGRAAPARSACCSQCMHSLAIEQQFWIIGHKVVDWTDGFVSLVLTAPRSMPAFPTPLRRIIGHHWPWHRLARANGFC